MPKHTDIESLDPCIQQRVRDCIEDMKSDPVLKKAKYTVVLLETRRDLAVQMAYAVKNRIKALPDDGKTDLQWVQYFFRKAGLAWQPTAEENTRPSTWTLDSKHIDGLAFDAALSKDGVNPDWKAPEALWDRLACIGEKHGFRAGRRWKSPDSPHFEEP